MTKKSKRDQILETAGKLFIEKGFQAVSVDQIAASVPVSKPTLYVHFKDKRALFTAVVQERCKTALASMRAGIDESRSAQENLENFGRQFTDLLLSRTALQFHRVIIGESESFPAMACMFYDTGPRQTLMLLEEYLAAAHKKKLLYVPDPARSAECLISMLKGSTHMQCLLGIKKEVSAPERKKLATSAVEIFLRGHAPRK